MKKLDVKVKDKKIVIVNFRLTESMARKFSALVKILGLKKQHVLETVVEAFVNGKL